LIFVFEGSVRRSNDFITVDYDEIDRRDPPLFLNGTKTTLAVAAGETVTLECQVQNIAHRTVSFFYFCSAFGFRLFKLLNKQEDKSI